MTEGLIIRALSGFYDVMCPEREIRCRARGRFRLDGSSPLVGDRVRVSPGANGGGTVSELLPRKNFFVRPAVANIDLLVIFCAAVNPVTDPFLIDRVAASAVHAGCGVAIVVNKCDLDPGDRLYDIYSGSGFPVLRTSAATGQGVEALRDCLKGKICALTGNSGVGKSSLLNALSPSCAAAVGEVSEKLGRGRHTTRHVELFNLGDDTFVADTPGFASFELRQTARIRKEELQFCFPEFQPYLGRCRFDDCAHLTEPGCAVLSAVEEGLIPASRHTGYVRLYNICAQVKDWER